MFSCQGQNTVFLYTIR